MWRETTSLAKPKANDDALDARWVSRQVLASLPVNEKTRLLLETKFDFQVNHKGVSRETQPTLAVP